AFFTTHRYNTRLLFGNDLKDIAQLNSSCDWLFLAFLSGNALNCTECTAAEWGGCNGTVNECAAGQKCVSAASELIEDLYKGKQVTKKVARSCVDAGFCNADLSFNFKYASWKIKTVCDRDQGR
ncbi:hypothetical protein AAFF_G00233140, partial [Aldrovandia affinis]